MNDVKVIDNTEKVNGKLLEALLKGLEKCGMKGESYAKKACPTDSGALMNSITHQVIEDDHSVIIGTDMEYAVYVELGTGAYAKGGGGRAGWWVYVKGGGGSSSKSTKTYTYDEAKKVVAILRSKGLDAHMTQGMKPRPYLKPVAEQHGDEFRKILESAIKNG